MPEPASWEQVEDLFYQALELAPEARAAWIADQPGATPEVAAEVQSLLDAFEEQDHIQAEAPATKGAMRFGAYEVERQIGQGGMGAVYLANRVEGQFRQQVAIKVVSRQGFGELFLERFRLERQILASLNHPGIARLVDGGVGDDGSIYLAMEYVEGARIDSYCDESHLDLRVRVRLFQAVCAAVQYAHRNLVVHRDLKPDNILVQKDGAPKLLDFGAAKLLTPLEEHAETELTQAGFHTFTPAFASPEQVLGQPVTTASDIYSLGVILYRLLTGRPPYELKDSSTGQLVEVVCKQEPAPAGIDGDLDAVIARCLRKDPEARYRSVDELNDDLTLYLEGRPVLARGGAVRYRAWKFVQRNKALAVSAALVAVTLVAGVAGVLWQARIARSRYQDLRRLTKSVLFELDDVIRDLPGSTPAQKLLVTRVLDSLDKLAAESSSDRVIQADLVQAYTKMGNLQANPYEQNLGDTDGGMATLRKALAISDRLLREHPSDPEVIHANALVRGSIGDLLFGSGKPKEAIENETAAATALEKLASEPGASAVTIVEAAVAYETLGDEYGQVGVASMGDPKAALANYNKSLELNARAIAADPNYPRPRRGRAVLQMKIGSIQLDTNPEQARDTFLAALKIFNELPEKETTGLSSRRVKANLLRKTGTAYEALEEWDSALSYYNQSLRTEEAFAAVDPDDSREQLQLAIVLNNIALVEDGKGDHEAALETSRRVASLLGVLIRRDPENPVWRGNLADVEIRMSEFLEQKGATAEASRLKSRANATARELAARPGATVLDLCRAGRMLGDVGFAEKCAELGGQNPDNLRVLAKAYRGAGRIEDARRVARQGLAMLALTRPTFLRRELEEAAR